jgi:hypothetical protein
MEAASHGEGGCGTLDAQEEEELVQLLNATIGGASGLERCVVTRRTRWQGELSGGAGRRVNWSFELRR